jgi:hypothetical protein
MTNKSIYEQRKRDRQRLLKIKKHIQPINKILEQIKEEKVEIKINKKIK